MKILFVFTGGTIGSSAGSEYIGIDRDKPYKLIETYREKYGIDFDYDTAEPVTLLSENSTGSSISSIVNAVSEKISQVDSSKDPGTGSYDGIIVTHGTDTLQYTSAALGYCLGLDCIPVCVVSADRPIEDPSSNGIINLHAAVNFIKVKAGRGVWTVYKNTDEDYTRIHRAARLLAHQTCSANLYSIRDEHYGTIDEKGCFRKNEAYSECSDALKPLNLNLADVSKSILRISAYPGMPVPAVAEETKYIILESFHSGTINTAYEGYRSFFTEMHERDIKVFLTGSPAASLGYESTAEFDAFHITPLPGIAPIALYMKLWLMESTGSTDDITKPLGGDLPHTN